MRTAKVLYSGELVREVMRKDRVVSVPRVVDTIAVSAGHKMIVRDIIANTVYNLARVDELAEGLNLVTFLEDAIITAEGLTDADLGDPRVAMNIRFARRPVAPWEEIRDLYRDKDGYSMPIFHNRLCKAPDWRKVLAALLEQGETPVKVPGGLYYVRAYCENVEGYGAETIIPAPPAKGSEEAEGLKSLYDVRYCFIVNVAEYDALLATLMPREEDNRGFSMAANRHTSFPI